MTEDPSSFKTKMLSFPPKPPRIFNLRPNRFNLTLLAVVIIGGALLYQTDRQRREVASQLEQTSAELAEVRQATEQEDTNAAAQEILAKVRQHLIVPDQPEPTVASIVNIESLREASSFYEPAENGDYLILTERRAILYDPDLDLILDIVPIQTNASASSSPSPTPTDEAE